MNIRIETYLLKDSNTIIRNLENIDVNIFINIKQDPSRFKETMDFDYLSGAIVIEQNEKEILGFKEWDLVDQLWDYFVDAIHNYLIELHASFTFPDQPLRVKLDLKDKYNCYLTIGDTTTTLNSQDLLGAIINSAIDFYEKLMELFPESSSLIDYSLNRAKDVKTKLDKYYAL